MLLAAVVVFLSVSCLTLTEATNVQTKLMSSSPSLVFPSKRGRPGDRLLSILLPSFRFCVCFVASYCNLGGGGGGGGGG